jgi:hypothetical protein
LERLVVGLAEGDQLGEEDLVLQDAQVDGEQPRREGRAADDVIIFFLMALTLS